MSENSKIESMRHGGKILHDTLALLVTHVKPGVTGRELDTIAFAAITNAHAQPAFLNYNGFPNSLCVSINDEVVHGIPSAYKCKVGDVVKLDLGVKYNNFFTDSAITVIVGEHEAITIDTILAKNQADLSESEKLLFATHQSLYKGIEAVKAGATTGDIGNAVQELAESFNFGVVRDLVGHGVGNAVHEGPSVPNYGKKGTGAMLKEGQTIAIEPMITVGSWKVTTDPDGWTIRTRDTSLAAHFEHTILVTNTGYEILT